MPFTVEQHITTLKVKFIGDKKNSLHKEEPNCINTACAVAVFNKSKA